MRLLLLWPPHIPSYFNAGHHLGLFLTSAFLRREMPEATCRVLDAGALNITWKDLGDVLFEQFDVIGIMNEYDAVSDFGRTVEYARALCPDARLITFGRLSRDIPKFFERFDLDAIAESGDHESCVATYASAVERGVETEGLHGVRVRQGEEWIPASAVGEWLEPERWVLPDISEIPYDAYDRMYARDENKFCGIPERRELVIPVARGCPVNCDFCDVPRQQGLRERRLAVSSVVDYLVASFAKAPFEYATMYAPTFTLRREWVLELCVHLDELQRSYAWKCTTTLHHLDAMLVQRMAEAGCVRISVGLETLEHATGGALPRLKCAGESRLEEVASWCASGGIELNCFVMLGLPGTSPEGAAYTMDRVRSLGSRVRPTVYTSYQEMSERMSVDEIGMFNRQIFRPDQVDDAARWYHLLFGHEPSPTAVQNRIPVWAV